MGKPHVVITSIQPPNRVMCAYAEQCAQHGFEFIVVGDSKSPPDFSIDGCRFVGVGDADERDFQFAAACPPNHYARKNIGYLLAMARQADFIVETDDDNLPRPGFWAERQHIRRVPCLDRAGWVNAYRYFTDAMIWPRGLPLNAVRQEVPPLDELPIGEAVCPIQQGLADGDPDVDAIYRLLLPLPLTFRSGIALALGDGSWCPFNSQNTAWWPEAYPLLYLPSYCSFRMTDIWRSFVAQRIAWANGWRLLMHDATVFQDRNEHNLMRDFEQEVPGYLGNARIATALAELPIEAGSARMFDNLVRCYRALVDGGFVGSKELSLLDCWIADCRATARLPAKW
jgi:hypothetical protein